MMTDDLAGHQWLAYNKAAYKLRIEAEEAAEKSRDFGRGLAYAATILEQMRDAVKFDHSTRYDGMGNYVCETCGMPTGGWPCPNGPNAVPMDPETHMPVAE